MHGGILREEAWKDLSKEINVQYRDSSQEELEAMIQGTDLEKVFQAAYVLCVRFPQERGQVENLLRLKVSSEGYKKKIYACLGDLYFQQGNTIEANRLYRKSIRLPK